MTTKRLTAEERQLMRRKAINGCHPDCRCHETHVILLCDECDQLEAERDRFKEALALATRGGVLRECKP